MCLHRNDVAYSFRLVSFSDLLCCIVHRKQKRVGILDKNTWSATFVFALSLHGTIINKTGRLNLSCCSADIYCEMSPFKLVGKVNLKKSSQRLFLSLRPPPKKINELPPILDMHPEAENVLAWPTHCREKLHNERLKHLVARKQNLPIIVDFSIRAFKRVLDTCGWSPLLYPLSRSWGKRKTLWCIWEKRSESLLKVEPIHRIHLPAMSCSLLCTYWGCRWKHLEDIQLSAVDLCFKTKDSMFFGASDLMDSGMRAARSWAEVCKDPLLTLVSNDRIGQREK